MAKGISSDVIKLSLIPNFEKLAVFLSAKEKKNKPHSFARHYSEPVFRASEPKANIRSTISLSRKTFGLEHFGFVPTRLSQFDFVKLGCLKFRKCIVMQQ